MFKVLKYFLWANLYQKGKKSFFILFASLVSLLLVSFIFNDLLSMANISNFYMLIVFKWLLNLIFLSLIGWSVLQIVTIATTSPFTSKNKETNEQKERVLNKEKLMTKQELILQKYAKVQQ